ncbi:MAG: hypothetical protein WCL70_09970 [Paludibacter sp.]
MNQSENTLLKWVLLIAGILLIILYSPFGSPELYSNRKYYDDNQGVNFNVISIASRLMNIVTIQPKIGSVRGSIPNIRTIKNSPMYGDYYTSGTELYVQDEYSGGRVHYKPVRMEPSSGAQISLISDRTFRFADPKYHATGYVSYEYNGSGTIGNYTEPSTLAFYRKNSSTHGPMNAGITASTFKINGDTSRYIGGNNNNNDSTALLASNNSLFRDQVNSDNKNNGGGTHPGNEPVPIPDGWGYMIMLAGLYGGYIFLRNKRVGVAKL